jgi:GNAT superfamily N-acetyltransferase
MAIHFAFYDDDDDDDDDELVGFFCINDEGYLLQFFLDEQHQCQSPQLFDAVLQGAYSAAGQINGAFVSTAKPRYLSLCLDRFSKCDVNALMYQRDGAPRKQDSQEDALAIVPIGSLQLAQAVEFAAASIGAGAGWLNGYYGNLINRQELFGVWKGDRLIATGESRGFDDYQTEYVEVGMIVAESERGRGLATQIMRRLVAMNDARGLKSICSTEKTNIAAQKAIGRAGFFASNRIVQFYA